MYRGVQKHRPKRPKRPKSAPNLSTDPKTSSRDFFGRAPGIGKTDISNRVDEGRYIEYPLDLTMEGPISHRPPAGVEVPGFATRLTLGGMSCAQIGLRVEPWVRVLLGVPVSECAGGLRRLDGVTPSPVRPAGRAHCRFQLLRRPASLHARGGAGHHIGMPRSWISLWSRVRACCSAVATSCGSSSHLSRLRR